MDKRVYEQLISTLDSFSEECAQFGPVIQQLDARKWSGLEETFTYIDTAFANLKTHSSQMSNARATLGTARNRSRSLVPFDKLPDEIIVYILSLASADRIDSQHDHDSSGTKQLHSPLPISIWATSRRLRNITINTPSLWTYVNLLVDEHRHTYLQHGQLFLLRSGQLPLHIRIAGGVADEDEKTLKLLTGLLTPHTHRIASLDFQVPLSCAWIVMTSLFSDTSSCQTRELCFNDSDSNLGSGSLYDDLNDDDLDDFLESIQVLGMLGFFIPFESPAYYGLTVLKIMPFEFIVSGLKLLELRNALATCPELRSLALIDCQFETSPEAPVEPVFLPNLEVLDLRFYSDDSLTAMISMIHPGSKALAFSVSFEQFMSQAIMAGLRYFMEQSNVTRLCIEGDFNPTNDLGRLLVPPGGKVSAVQELAINCYNFEKLTVKQPFDAYRFPFLHTLHLMDCYGLDVHKCNQPLDASTIQVIKVDEPALEAGIPGAVPSIEYSRYFTICNGEGECEWPLYLFDK
ncbi:hypothetical protein FRC07_007286 [Ceratobasidium sp. 392]|nr:hypothetical protein FRC07_007286 [Ceratobasidium sp. 392]